MQSRYDFFKESSVLDEDGQAFPDPLSVNYNNGKLEKIPQSHKITVGELSKPWTLVENFYGIEYYDDILLNENNIPYITTLAPGDTIYIPHTEDLDGFVKAAVSDVLDINNY